MHIYPDEAFQAITPSQTRPTAEIAFDIPITPHIAIGLAWHTGTAQNTLYAQTATFTENALHLSALYRHPLHPVLTLTARLGPTIDWYELQIGPDDATGLTSHQWHIGARAALGAEFWPISHHWLPIDPPFAAGLAAEIFYDLALLQDWTDDAIDPGPLDPSGPGWLLGLVLRF